MDLGCIVLERLEKKRKGLLSSGFCGLILNWMESLGKRIQFVKKSPKPNKIKEERSLDLLVSNSTVVYNF